MKKTKFKKNLSRTIKKIDNGSKIRGITLISLVITIVILVILAGVTIVQLNNNGLLKNAKLAREKYTNSQKEENFVLDDYTNQINGLSISSRNFKNINYSLTEQELGTTWIDGKKLYQITRLYDNNGNGYGNMSDYVNLENIKETLNVDTVIYAEHLRSSIDVNFDFSKSAALGDPYLYFVYDGGYLKCSLTNTATRWKICVTFIYTKTTD